MNTRREFLIKTGCAVGCVAALAVPASRSGAANMSRTAAQMERWLLATGRSRLNPKLLERVVGQIKTG